VSLDTIAWGVRRPSGDPASLIRIAGTVAEAAEAVSNQRVAVEGIASYASAWSGRAKEACGEWFRVRSGEIDAIGGPISEIAECLQDLAAALSRVHSEFDHASSTFHAGLRTGLDAQHAAQTLQKPFADEAYYVGLLHASASAATEAVLSYESTVLHIANRLEAAAARLNAVQPGSAASSSFAMLGRLLGALEAGSGVIGLARPALAVGVGVGDLASPALRGNALFEFGGQTDELLDSIGKDNKLIGNVFDGPGGTALAWFDGVTQGYHTVDSLGQHHYADAFGYALLTASEATSKSLPEVSVLLLAWGEIVVHRRGVEQFEGNAAFGIAHGVTSVAHGVAHGVSSLKKALFG